MVKAGLEPSAMGLVKKSTLYVVENMAPLLKKLTCPSGVAGQLQCSLFQDCRCRHAHVPQYPQLKQIPDKRASNGPTSGRIVTILGPFPDGAEGTRGHELAGVCPNLMSRYHH